MPSLGVSKPAIILSTVVLPDPEGPSIAKNSPSAMSRSIPATAVTGPKDLRRPLRETAGAPGCAPSGWDDMTAVSHRADDGFQCFLLSARPEPLLKGDIHDVFRTHQSSGRASAGCPDRSRTETRGAGQAPQTLTPVTAAEAAERRRVAHRRASSTCPAEVNRRAASSII